VRIVNGLAERNPPPRVLQVADLTILDGKHVGTFGSQGGRERRDNCLRWGKSLEGVLSKVAASVAPRRSDEGV
jgi:hypothetical protein